VTGTPRRLYLLRHAKSSWDSAGVPDRDRPLAPRGQRAVAALRQHFADIELQVDLVLCSPARRTRETWAGVADGLAGKPRTEFVEQIYGAETADLLTVVREVDPDVESLLLIGHNPGFGDLAYDLAGDGDPPAVARLREGYPTAGFATFSLGAAWSDVRRGSGRLVDFVRPRDLGAR
jgi:phosphohistidine phosphatase